MIPAEGGLGRHGHPGQRVVGIFDEIVSGTTLEYPVSLSWQEAMAAYLNEAEHGPASKPRLAATVMLVRDSLAAGQAGVGEPRSPLEVFVMRRARSMAFAPEVVAFPGGGVTEEDCACDIPWVGPSPAQWAEHMGCDEEQARGVVVAAVRELFEECGVLLAGADGESLVRPEEKAWSEQRKKLISHEVSLASVLRCWGLALRSDCLFVRSHWVTPPFEKRRYDTYFFTALVPEGQRPDGDTTEASAVCWADPGVVLDRFKQGDVSLVPPTIANLAALSRAGSAGEVLGQAAPQRIMLEPDYDKDHRLVLRCELA